IAGRRLAEEVATDSEKASRLKEDRDSLKKILEHYLQTDSLAQHRAEVLDGFYRYAQHFDQLGEKIDRIQINTYEGLALLEQIFIDKENLSGEVKPELEEVFEEHTDT